MSSRFLVCAVVFVLLVSSPSSRKLLASAAISSTTCAEAVAAAVGEGFLSNSNVTQAQLAQVVGAVLRTDTSCITATVTDLKLTWEQYPSWVNGAFTEWIWHLKTDAATAQYFSRVRFDGPLVLPAPSTVTASMMREYASIHNEDAIVYSSDLSGFSPSWAVEQKGIPDFAENVCLDAGTPRGLLHPRAFLLLFYRPDALAALRAAAATPAAAAAAAGPPADWDGLLALLEAHAAAVQTTTAGTSIGAWADAAASGGGSGMVGTGAGAVRAAAGALPRYGLCITTHPTCGRLSDVFAAVAASVLQSGGTQQGYVFDLAQPPPAAVPLVGSAGWRYAADVLRRLLAYNAPDYFGGDVNITAATNCHAYSPWFGSGDCLVTIEADAAFISMGVSPLNASGALGVAPLPGSKIVTAPGGAGLQNCTRASCAVSANHDLLYLTPTGQQPQVLAAARAASAKCGPAEAARMQAAAAAVANGLDASVPVVNRAPYSTMYDYYAFINYELMGMVGLGQEMSLIQLNIASRFTSERTVRQGALDAVRSVVGANANGAASSSTIVSNTSGSKWDAAAYASTPWWAALSGGSEWAPPATAVAPFVARGLDAGAVATYLRAVWHGLYSPNAAPDIAAPAMVNWFKWGLGHAALSLLPPQPASTDAVAALLTRVFGAVNDAHTPASVRAAYEVAIDAPMWLSSWGSPGSTSLTPSARAAVYAGSVCGVVVVCLLVVLLLRQRSRHRDLLGRVRAPRAGLDTTLLISDVQSSTKLWEQLPVSVMDEALKLHHTTFRRLLPQFNGYESATEGDSFILAFADPASAVAFASACQVALLLQPWPTELLTHPDGSTVLMEPQGGEAAQRAGVPGAEGRLLPGAGRGAKAPGSLASRLTWPARYLSARVRVAATSATGRRSGGGGGGGGGAGSAPRPLPPHLRSSNAAAAYEVRLSREISYDLSVYSGGGSSVYRGRSLDSSAQHTPRFAGAGAAGFSTRSLALHAGRAAVPGAAAAGCEDFPGTPKSGANAVPCVSVGGSGGGGGGFGHEPAAANPATPPSLPVKGDPHTKSAPLLISSGAAASGAGPDCCEPSRTEGGTGRPTVSSSKLFVVREGSSGQLPVPSVRTTTAASAAFKEAATVQELGPGLTRGSCWCAALQAVFPAVAANDAPAAVLGGQSLKSPTVLLAGGRLAVVAYRGLRVRMGLHTGLDDPQHIAFNKVGSTFKYYGPFAETTKTAISAAPGAMVVMTEPSFTRLRNAMARRQHAATKWQRDHGAVVVYGGHHVMPASDHPAPPVAAKGERPAAARGVQIDVGTTAAAPPAVAPPAAPDDDSGEGAAVVLAAPAPAEGVALFQAVPAALVCRLALSPPLTSVRVAQLGSLAAPVGSVTVAFAYVVGASTLLADLPGPASRALEQFQTLACGLLAEAGGYLVEGGDGLLLAAFGSPLAGVEWALDCSAGLKQLEWEEDLLSHWLCEEVLSVGLASAGLDTEPVGGGGPGAASVGVGLGPVLGLEDAEAAAAGRAASLSRRGGVGREFDRLPSMAKLGAIAHTQRMLERGLRIKVGLDTGRASHWLTDASGRLSYRGKVMNRASRVAGKAAAGQVVCTDVTWAHAAELGAEAVGGRASSGSVANGSGGGVVGVSLGKVLLRGVTAPVELIQCMRN